MTTVYLPSFLLFVALVPLPAQVIIPLPITPPQQAYTALETYLNLSDAEVQSLIQVQNNRNLAQQAIYQQISAKQTQLGTLLQSGTTDALTVGQLEIDINNLSKQLSIPNGPYRASALAVLTADQKNKLAALVSALQLQGAASQAVTLDLIDGPAPVFTTLPAMPPVPIGVVAAGGN